jgi:class 3 adenylate cyclase
MKRRIAAIMIGDVVGYSAMMEGAEERTAERLGACQAVVAEKVALLDGRVFNTAGDATLAEFPSAINAVRCAAEIRSAIAGAAETEPLRMRFGIHLADVIVRGNDLVGDGVNLAARIQQAAEPDAIHVSGMLFDHIRRNSPFRFEAVGEQRFKNISEPTRVYRLRDEMDAHRLQSAQPRRPGRERNGSARLLFCHSAQWAAMKISAFSPKG